MQSCITARYNLFLKCFGYSVMSESLIVGITVNKFFYINDEIVLK